MKTVYDLIRRRATLEIICQNCEHRGTVNHRFLMTTYGGQGVLTRLPFKCTRCSGERVRLKPVPDDLGEPPPLKLGYFSGVHQKYQD